MKITNTKDLYLNPAELGLLIMINSNASGDSTIRNYIRTWLFEEDLASLMKFEDNGLVEYVKTGKNDWDKLRISDKGSQYLKNLSTSPISDTASNTWDYLKSLYIKADLKNKIVNETKTKFYIQCFLDQKASEGREYTDQMMKAVVKAYIMSFDEDKLKFAKKTLNLFFDPSNAYATKWSIEDCPLYDFVNNNQKEIRNAYKSL